ncbi:uncharacterized protein LOC100875648 [Megachile rotundata]|uniref:uncharacterized protein LOC100875648 n=1 Tax=Megachile rotundata TaxID=143995 RepID=UPI000258F299|nr:PREDICTED: uncharacterized protein LOC100875648 [Megachile rotundata]
MMRSKIQIIKYLIFLLILVLIQSAVCNGNFRINRNVPEQINGIAKKDNAHNASDGQKIQQQHATTIPEDNKTVDDTSLKPDINKTTQVTGLQNEHVGEGHSISLNVGALKRGFYVFVGLSVLVMAYIVFRSFRLSKTRAQMVRKYGVLTHRQDVEMRPLPLSEEDDEDTTVFDASNVLTNNVQHQNL